MEILQSDWIRSFFINSISRGGARHFHLVGPLEGPVLQQGELSMVCVGFSERDLILGEPLGGQAKFWGGSAPPSSAPVYIQSVSENLKLLTPISHQYPKPLTQLHISQNIW